ncbi:hypothetical protein BCR37DRAFT_384227 [Protomyces lactucae-debilis]|uniref:Uncharacterized protein n=1 Tax=Protomyces lactucae-debilis TaxID=2754530 RepID=A0A1Y2ETC9_PROLT|nr:uncharacterized protein BCR37DRAFT_384227 [Protomyces lactucae-debilis]ORY74809.1 hypothetical protein BCR37DRAFT_384227 [Protomyces lactucae-debilis]
MPMSRPRSHKPGPSCKRQTYFMPSCSHLRSRRDSPSRSHQEYARESTRDTSRLH